MKKIFFLIIGILIFSTKNIYAQNATFYEAEYVDNIYINKYNYANNTIYFQKARFFRQSGNDQFAYCIEPFNFFDENSGYTSTNTPNSLTVSQKKRIEQIAYFGYQYDTHNESKWYAITQYMIWKEAAGVNGDIYFTEGLNGNRVNYYTDEINEIERLIRNYNTLPSIANKTIKLFPGEQSIHFDDSDIMQYYTTEDIRLQITSNSINIRSTLNPGEHEFYLTRLSRYYNDPVLFFQSSNSQNLVTTGNIEDREISFKVLMLNGSITIKKYDKDTLKATPQGHASLDGAIYEIFDKNNTKKGEIKIVNGKGTIQKLSKGTYTIKEKKAGTGYTLDKNTYTITIDEDNPTKEINLYNKIIEKKVKIIKKYGEENNFIPEENIKFGIYDDEDNLIKEIITNSLGEASITLPYGEYSIVQLTSTEGYTIVEPFSINIEDNEEEIIELKNYKIPVPDTYINISFIKLLFKYIYTILC